MSVTVLKFQKDLALGSEAKHSGQEKEFRKVAFIRI